MIYKPAIVMMLFQVSMIFAQSTACNCCSDAHDDFDFWVGTWNVTNTDGTPAGTNTITKEEGGCILRENWTSAKAGFTGTSLNFFNQKTMQWEQLWVDNTGSYLKLKGNRTDNTMVMISDEFTHTDGQQYMNRITWRLNDDGSVNQLWEVLQDGEVKQVAFNGHYKRIE